MDPIVVQAEDGVLSEGPGGGGASQLMRVITAAGSGAVGDAYADFGKQAGDALTVSPDISSAGDYRVAIRYVNGSTADRPLDLSVDGGAAVRVSFPPTGGWGVWATVEIDLPFGAGAHDLRLAIPSGFSDGPNIDELSFTPLGAPSNQPPTGVALTSGGVAENAAGAAVGFLSATDPDGDDAAVTFSTTDARFAVAGNALSLAAGTALDFEAGASVDVVVTATDAGGASSDATVSVTVLDENEAPTLAAGASLLPVTVAQGSAATVDLSVLGASDPDAGDAASYAVRLAGGGAAPAGVSVSGTTLSLPDDLALGALALEVFAVDGAGLESAPVALAVSVTEPLGEEPGPRDTIRVNFQRPFDAAPTGYLKDSFDPYGDRGNGQTYGWVTEDSVLDADPTVSTPISGTFPSNAINVRAGTVTLPDDGSLPADQRTVDFSTYDPRLLSYAHFDRPDFTVRTAWEIALADGWYEVTVGVGDPGGANDSDYRLFIEGALTSAWSNVSAFKAEQVTAVAEVTDGLLTLSAQGGNVTEIHYVDIRALPDLTPDDANPAPDDYNGFTSVVGISRNDGSVVALDPADGSFATIAPSSDIVLGIDFAAGRGGVLLDSLGDGSIRLIETLTGAVVAFTANTTAGFDSITITPDAALKPFTNYTLIIDGARDRGPVDAGAGGATREFEKFSTSFLTGAVEPPEPSAVAFTDTLETTDVMLTSVAVSPDGAYLYAAGLTGQIVRWAVDPADGSLSNRETLTLSTDHFNTAGAARGIVGLAFDPENPSVLWVTDNDPIPLNGRDNGVPDFSGRISKITLDGGAAFSGDAETYVRGLPRSNGDHVTNSIVFRANPDAAEPDAPAYLMYVAQGSNSSLGEANVAWGYRPERLLSAAVLEIDHTRTAPAGGFDVSTEPLPQGGVNRRFGYSETVDGVLAPTDDGDLTNGGIFITSGPFTGYFLHFTAQGVATVRETADSASAIIDLDGDGSNGLDGQFYDPFAADAPVRLFATGARNAYDLVAHGNGFIYAPTNGSSSGGALPDDPSTPGVDESLEALGVQDDYLFRLSQGSFHGHTNPVRGEFIGFGGNPTAGADPQEISAYPEGVQPNSDFDPAANYSLGRNRSPNGAIEYRSAVFGDLLQGAILVTEYSAGNTVRALTLDASGAVTGDFILRNVAGDPISYVDPLDIIEGADGRLYLLTLDRSTGQSQIVRLDPTPPTDDVSADAEGDLRFDIVNAERSGQVVFDLDGVDADIVSVAVSFDGGATFAPVLRDGRDRVMLDMSGFADRTPVQVRVTDAAGNTASAGILFDPATGSQIVDGPDLELIDDGASGYVLLDDPATHNGNPANDLNGDGLNDNFIGAGYVDINGGAGDKLRYVFDAPAAGDYLVSVRYANGSATTRGVELRSGAQSVAISDTRTGAWTAWQEVGGLFTLQAGSNSFILAQTDSQNAPNIDALIFTPVSVGETLTPDAIADVGGVNYEVYEAEEAFLSGPMAVSAAVAGRPASGDAFIAFTGSGAQSAEWLVEVAEAGVYDLRVEYALSPGADPRSLSLAVDGAPGAVVAFEAGPSADWTDKTVKLFLSAGAHSIELQAADGVGPDIDRVLLSSQPVTPVFASVDGVARIETEAADGTVAILGGAEVLYYFTVDIGGVYALDVAANAGAPDGGNVRFLLSTDGGDQVEIGSGDFPGAGDAGETTITATLSPGRQYALSVVSEQPGAAALDYLDLTLTTSDAQIAIDSKDASYFSDRLHFSYLETPTYRAPDTTAARAFKDTGVVTISNTGTDSLVFSDATLTGPFVLDNPAIFDSLSLAPGGSIDVTVRFDRAQFTPPSPSNLTDETDTSFFGALQLSTNDGDDPVATVDLAGFWQREPEFGQEPSLNEIMAVFGFGNRFEGLGNINAGARTVFRNESVWEAIFPETEVLSPYWKIADGYDAARAVFIASYHGPTTAWLALHAPNDINNQDRETRAEDIGTQTILPIRVSTNPDETRFAIASIVPGEVTARAPADSDGDASNGVTVAFNDGSVDTWDGVSFGLSIGPHSTDPRLNPDYGPRLVATDGNKYDIVGWNGGPVSNYTYAEKLTTGTPETVLIADLDLVQQGHAVRVFQALDADLNPIDDTYIFAHDYLGINYDFNDSVVLIEGIAPSDFGQII